jgi:hypothetical protein
VKLSATHRTPWDYVISKCKISSSAVGEKKGENMKVSNQKRGNVAMTNTLKRDADKCLADVPVAYVFWCNDGRIIKNMRELKEALEQMDDAVYVYHVNSEKNDFSTWVKDVLSDEKLAWDLSKSMDRLEAARRVAARVTLLDE